MLAAGPAAAQERPAISTVEIRPTDVFTDEEAAEVLPLPLGERPPRHDETVLHRDPAPLQAGRPAPSRDPRGDRAQPPRLRPLPQGARAGRGDARRRRDGGRVDAPPPRVVLEQGRRHGVLDRGRGIQPPRPRDAVRLRVRAGDRPDVALRLLRGPERDLAARGVPCGRCRTSPTGSASRSRTGGRSTRSRCRGPSRALLNRADFDTKLYAGGEEAATWRKRQRIASVSGGTLSVRRRERREPSPRFGRVDEVRLHGEDGPPPPDGPASNRRYPLLLGGLRARRVRVDHAPAGRQARARRGLQPRDGPARRRPAFRPGFDQQGVAGRASREPPVGHVVPEGLRARSRRRARRGSKAGFKNALVGADARGYVPSGPWTLVGRRDARRLEPRSGEPDRPGRRRPACAATGSTPSRETAASSETPRRASSSCPRSGRSCRSASRPSGTSATRGGRRTASGTSRTPASGCGSGSRARARTTSSGSTSHACSTRTRSGGPGWLVSFASGQAF